MTLSILEQDLWPVLLVVRTASMMEKRFHVGIPFGGGVERDKGEYT